MKKITAVVLLAVLCMAVIVANAQSPGNTTSDQLPSDNSTSSMLSGTMGQKPIALEEIKNIELYDLEGKLICTLTPDAVSDIVAAYNSSIVDDISYIEMITGSRMVINFNDNTTINLTSYGSDTHVVAGGENVSYHLISPELAKILLEKR